MPVTNHIIDGTITDVYGNAVEEATVTLSHDSITPGLVATTLSDGTYTIDLAGLSSQWSVGETFTLKIEKTLYGVTSVERTISAGGSQTEDVAFTAESVYALLANSQDQHIMQFSMITDFAGNKITPLNRFPVEGLDPLDKYRPSDQDLSGDPSYYGFLDRSGNWYILRQNLSTGEFRYAKGSSEYATNWGNRSTTLTYDLFSEVF